MICIDRKQLPEGPLSTGLISQMYLRRFCAVTFSTLLLLVAVEVEQLAAGAMGREKEGKRQQRVWAALGIDEDEWLPTAASCFPLTFPALSVLVRPTGRCIWDAFPLVLARYLRLLLHPGAFTVKLPPTRGLSWLPSRQKHPIMTYICDLLYSKNLL